MRKEAKVSLGSGMFECITNRIIRQFRQPWRTDMHCRLNPSKREMQPRDFFANNRKTVRAHFLYDIEETVFHLTFAWNANLPFFHRRSSLMFHALPTNETWMLLSCKWETNWFHRAFSLDKPQMATSSLVSGISLLWGLEDRAQACSILHFEMHLKVERKS